MNEYSSRIINHPRRNIVVTGVVAFAGGVGAGYFLGRRSVSFGVHEEPTQLSLTLPEAEVVRDIGVMADQKLFEPLVIPAEALESMNGNSLSPLSQPEPEAEPELETRSVFAGNDETWDYQAEILSRSDTEPYVLHKDEFFEDEKDYSQITLTYYAGDNIMADDAETPVYNYEQLTGPLKFGHGSGDPNCFYVRNDKRHAEYEVLRHDGMFAVEVLGLDESETERTRDIKHSAPKFRRDD